MIQSSINNLTIGIKSSDEIKTTFGLYDQPDDINNIDDRLLFKIEIFRYKLKVQISSFEFNKNFNDIVEMSKKSVDLIDTEFIDNNSPATLVHEVNNVEEFIESYSTFFSNSNSFLELFSKSTAAKDSNINER